MTATPTTDERRLSDVDISSTAFWNLPFDRRDEAFATLRREAPVSWHPSLEVAGMPPEIHGEPGYWAVVKAHDISYVSRNHELFSSDARTFWGINFRPNHPDFKMAPHFLEMDPPDHTYYRKILSSAFKPSAVRRLTDKIEQRAEEIVAGVVGAGEIDFVTEVAAKLPMLTVADMIGVPDELSHAFAEAGDKAIGARDPDINPDVDPLEFLIQQLGVLREIGLEVIADRRKNPQDDVATALALAEIDGKPLSDDEIQSVMLLLSVAGNDTTKQTTAHTVLQLWRNPEQRAWLAEDFDGRIDRSIDEFIRHASPVLEFARTATRDTELNGQSIAAGDKLVMFYCSANRDEDEFADAHRFDLSREPHPHSGFGGGGIHFCLGAAVGRSQLSAMFRRILTKLPDMEVGEPELLQSEFIHGIRRLQVRIP
ncbi:cytochrome P450 [Nocardioides insulae]|uniref:cytochrome P450 n=1 Tax=Nocardioides insulae TaxID=394734 RepID=UPI0003FFB20C|nr:cytochrome P450 [Nocardioides insulae]